MTDSNFGAQDANSGSPTDPYAYAAAPAIHDLARWCVANAELLATGRKIGFQIALSAFAKQIVARHCATPCEASRICSDIRDIGDLDPRAEQLEQGVAEVLDPMDDSGLPDDIRQAAAKTFCISHHYDVGDQRVYVKRMDDAIDVKRAAAYIVASAEHWFGNVIVSNLGVAAALVQFYGCRHCAAGPATDVDLYDVIPNVGYGGLLEDVDLQREGLREYIECHADRAG